MSPFIEDVQDHDFAHFLEDGVNFSGIKPPLLIPYVAKTYGEIS